MKIHKIAATVMISVLTCLVLESIWDNNSSRGVYADFASTPTPRPLIRPNETPIRLFMPLIFKNSPSAIGCITLTAGLTPVGTHCSDPTIGLNFTTANGVNGAATTVARGDHTHAGQQWITDNSVGFSVVTTATNGYALTGYNSASSGSGVGVFGNSFSDSGNGVYGRQGTGSGISPPAPAAVWGDSNNNWGILGTSTNYVGVVGISTNSDGVRGASTNGIGVRGSTSASTAPAIIGTAPVTGVVGIATNTSGVNNGVYGFSDNWNGVWGNSNSGTGVSASSNSGAGLYATSTSGFAIQADGDAKQTFSKGGIAKAMAYISYNSITGDSTVLYCYNSRESGAAVNTVPCNFTVTRNSVGDFKVAIGTNTYGRYPVVTPIGQLVASIGGWVGSGDLIVQFNTPSSGSLADPSNFFIIFY